ncbi:MAG TPA: mechanosensitive ion channel family protein [Gemmatimonadales bacterium]|nr:mechanosensitive ion channel family protein [Gemmatimonadales bacterium]
MLFLAVGAAQRTALDAQQAPPGADTARADSLAPERVTAERTAQDEVIRNKLQAVFDRVPGLDRVDVTVDAGVVRLEGTVINAGTRTRAVALAAAMDEVVFVDDRIRESTSLEEQLEPTWARLRELGYGTVAKLPLLVVALLIIALAAWLGSLLARWSGPSFLRTRNPFLQGLIRRLVQGIVVVVGIILALDLLDATALVGAVAGTAGLAGLVIGFAFKDIVENYLAGTILAMRQPFAKNDQILVDTFEGKVVRLTPRETILMSVQGNHIRIPNAMIFRSPLINYTRNPLRRFEFDYGVGTTDDLEAAREVAVSTLTAMDGVLADPPPEALVVAIGESSVTMRSMAWVDQREADFLRVRSEAIRSVKKELEEKGFTLPSPEYVIRLQRDPQSKSATAAAAAPAQDRPARTVPADVSVDRAVDEQIEVERRVSDEDDLLDEQPKRS